MFWFLLSGAKQAQFGLRLSDATGSIAKGITVGRKMGLVPVLDQDTTAMQLFHK